MLAPSTRRRQDRDWFGKMSMHLSPFDDLNSGTTLANREAASRRIGVIVSILFLTSVGTLASLTSARAGAHEQAAPVVITAAPTALSAD